MREFQQRRGLRVDGVCGEQSWAALVEAGYRLGDRLLYYREPMLRGDDVVAVQRQLGAMGFHAGRADGIFGPETHASVQAFQRNAGLVGDGTVGMATISALRRLRSRGPEGDPAALRETALLQGGTPGLDQRPIALGESGGLGGLSRELQRVLGGHGRSVTVLGHPDPAALAAQANATGASVYLGLGLAQRGHGCATAFWGAHGSRSPAGERLARMILEELSICGAGIDGPPRPMNTPVLRETRMPAVSIDFGPPRLAVERSVQVATAVASAVGRWVDAPCTLDRP